MLRDPIDAPAPDDTPPADAPASAPQRPFRRAGLSGKLLVLTVLFVMVCEVAIYVPSIAEHRLVWLREAHESAGIAAIVLADSTPLPRETAEALLSATGALAIAVREGDRRRLLARNDTIPPVDQVVELGATMPWHPVLAAFRTLIADPGRILRITGPMPGRPDATLEIVIPEAPLTADLFAYSRRILVLSLMLSIMTAGLVYACLRWLLVRPIERLTAAMARFSEDPSDPARRIVPSGRGDEIGDAERRLASLQAELSRTIDEKSRLASLGLAVSKINHDLRNLLASAQLFSDRLASSPDPAVQRIAPKIVATLDRAIAYTSSVLAYGSAREAPPRRRLLKLSRVVDDVAELLGLPGHAAIQFETQVPPFLEVDADAEQLFRVLMNLARNAIQALESEDDPSLVRRLGITAERHGAVVIIRIADTGPGVPARAREKLFRPFEGRARPGGTGLGLAVALELIRAHGGSLSLVGGPPGAVFEIVVPDRPVDLAEARRMLAR
ncbi:sensor histidine kinase [Segnochrobactraceae bacterium EtOH-i3]